MRPRRPLPFVMINVAATVDGKLAPRSRRFVPFTSRRDQDLLLELRTRADAVMSGARTVDAGLVDLGPGPRRYRRMRLAQGRSEYNLRVIVSGSGSISPDAEIFRHRFSPIVVLTTTQAAPPRLLRLRQLADEVKVCGGRELDFAEALAWLRKRWNVRTLLCEGGGEVNAALFRQGLVDEVYLTLAPLIFGGKDAPTLAGGTGVKEVRDATSLRLKSCRRWGNELFLAYQVRKGARVRLNAEKRSETPSRKL